MQHFYKKKLVFISNIPSPYMVKLCYSLNTYFKSTFLFYTTVEKGGRPLWWNIPLGDSCKVIDNNIISWHHKFLNIKMIIELIKIKPDILILGGFSIPTNLLCYLQALLTKTKVFIFSEYLRKSDGKEKKPFFLHFIYQNISGLFAAGDHAKDYFIKYGFNKDLVLNANYPMDIDNNFKHPYRSQCKTLIFPHRLIEQFNPKGAILIASEVYKVHPSIKLLMNAAGPMRQECDELITKLKCNEFITYIDHIKNWDDLPEIYKQCDVCISPLFYSNGCGSLIELMASGLGIVISDAILWNRDMIKCGKNGFVLPPNDTQQFVDAVTQYIKHPSLLKKHAQINRRIVKQFSIETTAFNYADFINKHI